MSQIFEIKSAAKSIFSIWLNKLGLSQFVSLDLETTGLSPESDQIIEIGAVRFQDGEPVAEFRSFLNLDQSLDPFIIQLTGITDDDLKGAPAFSDVAEHFLDFVSDDPIVGQNIDFDLGFLRHAGETDLGRSSENRFVFPHSHAVDTAMLGRIFWPELSSFSLSSLARNFGVTLENAHRAADDALATGMILLRMIEKLPVRTWGTHAESLDRLIGMTNHRSRFFFKALLGLCKGIEKPRTTATSSPTRADMGDSQDLNLSELLGVGGVFERRLPFFDYRPPQLEMAESVEVAFSEGQILAVEAPTGVGKSLAYLVPALKWIREEPDSARQVIVSSHTKVLQEQLFRKDLREVSMAMGVQARAAVLKGRNNYLCRRRLQKLLDEADERLSDLDRIQLMPLLRWAELTTAGDISEISGFNPKFNPSLWAQVSSDSVACSGSTCGSSKGDFYRKAQEKSAKAEVVFVNHALLTSDWARFAAQGRRRIVLDEAHQIERAMVNAMTVEVSSQIFRFALSRLSDERTNRGLLANVIRHDSLGESSAKLIAAIEGQTRSLFTLIRQSFGELADRLCTMLLQDERVGKSRYRHGDRIHDLIVQKIGPLSVEWEDFVEKLNECLRELADLKGDDKLSPEMLSEFRSACETVNDLHERMLRVLIAEDDSNQAMWIEFGSGKSPWCTMFSAPVSVGAIMERSFWPGIESAILTSATLAVNGSFGVVREALGLAAQTENHDIREKIVSSPFQLDRQMRICIPAYFPDPRRSDGTHSDAICDLASRVVEEIPRGTLILCTSNEMVKRLTACIQPISRRLGRAFYSQDISGSLGEMLDRFRESRNGILIGAASFWEGIDVIGDALQILMVSRLPFDVPTDPWVSARTEALQDAGRDSFLEYSLPIAALRLKQGLGRLIRHPNDRGIAIIMDPRILTTRYGIQFQRSLPVAPKAVHEEEEMLQEIHAFFKG